MSIKRTTRQNAHYVCAGCGRAFQTILKLYGHEKNCKSRKAAVLSPPPSSQPAFAQAPEATQ